MEQLDRSGACADADMQDLVSRASGAAPDARRLDAFFKDEGVDAGRPGGRRRDTGDEAQRQSAYADLRTSGLAYGPPFRCMQGVYSLRAQEGATSAVHACLQMEQDEEND